MSASPETLCQLLKDERDAATAPLRTELAAKDKLIAELRRQRDHYLAESERLARVAQEEMAIRKRQEGLADRLIAELEGENEELFHRLSEGAIHVLEQERDSLRAQLEQGRANDETKRKAAALMYDLLNKELDTARQEIERVKNQSFLCEKHRLPIGMNDATPICPWCERDTTERVKADRDKALRVAEEAQKELELISDQLCGVKIEGEVTHAMVYQFVEGQIDKQSDRADKAQSDLSTLRRLVDEMAEAGLPFKRLADVFDDVRYREQWPDHTRLNGSTPAALTNNTIALHNFLTLGDCRKLKAIVNKLDAARHTALKAGGEADNLTSGTWDKKGPSPSYKPFGIVKDGHIIVNEVTGACLCGVTASGAVIRCADLMVDETPHITETTLTDPIAAIDAAAQKKEG